MVYIYTKIKPSRKVKYESILVTLLPQLIERVIISIFFRLILIFNQFINSIHFNISKINLFNTPISNAPCEFFFYFDHYNKYFFCFNLFILLYFLINLKKNFFLTL